MKANPPAPTPAPLVSAPQTTRFVTPLRAAVANLAGSPDFGPGVCDAPQGRERPLIAWATISVSGPASTSLRQ